MASLAGLVVQVGLLAKDVHNLEGCAVESFDSADLLHRGRQNRHNKMSTPLILSLNES